MEKKISCLAGRQAIYCDGGAIGNPGPAACAFIVYREGKIIYQFVKKIGRTTNNVAEYSAVIAALQWLKGNQEIFNFYLDSQLVVYQLTGLYKIKDSKLKKLAIEVKSLEREINNKISYHLIPRTKNQITDALVKKALSGSR